MQIQEVNSLPMVEPAILPSTLLRDSCECDDLCNCSPSMTRREAMTYCKTRINQSNPGSTAHAIYSLLLSKGELLEASDAFSLAHGALTEAFRGDYV